MRIFIRKIDLLPFFTFIKNRNFLNQQQQQLAKKQWVIIINNHRIYENLKI